MAIFCVETTDEKLRFGRFLHLLDVFSISEPSFTMLFFEKYTQQFLFPFRCRAA